MRAVVALTPGGQAGRRRGELARPKRRGEHAACDAIRASITGGWEPAVSDVEEREKRREKEPGASRDAGEMRATYTVAAALPLKNYHVAAAY